MGVGLLLHLSMHIPIILFTFVRHKLGVKKWQIHTLVISLMNIFLRCIGNLHNSYLKAKANVSKKKFYKNKIDTIKLTFDASFNDLDEETLIKTEINRQIDKSINNSIGTFHEEILGGITGFEMGNLSGFDIKATDDTLFADIKNKHNTMNSSSAESLFQKLAKYADTYKKANCYWVQVFS